jgi:CDP-4-dehydro-6-deoxyglucose reductase, E3
MPVPSEPRFREVELHASRALSPTVRSIVLRTVDGSELSWVGGQHVELLVPPGSAGEPGSWRCDPAWLEGVHATRHPFSIASPPDAGASDRIELAVGISEGDSVQGDSVSALVQGLRPGVRLGMVGPNGSFTRAGWWDEPAVFVATGTGVAPLRAMILADLRHRRQGPPMVLLFGCRTEEDLLWHAEFTALAAEHERFRYEPTLTRPGDGWKGRRGRVQEHVASLVREVGPVPVFAAGQAEMVADVRRVLASDLGHPPDRIRTEGYG